MIQAVVFDLDGTITRPFLNFKQIRLEIGVEHDRETLLELMEKMPEAERARADEILERHERDAAANAELNHGVDALLSRLAEQGLLTAVITRNSGRSTRRVLDKLKLEFDRVITRDDELPVKPDPAPLLFLAGEWGIQPAEILMVGDFRYDVMCGRAAGAITCLVTNGRELEDTGDPDYLVQAPGEVIGVLEKLGL